MARYVVLIDQAETGAYGVVFPDLLGCTAMGDTIEEALANAAEAAVDWAAEVRKDGIEIPAPRSAAEVIADPETKEATDEGAVLALVPLILDSGRPAKANLSIDSGLLDAIDEAAKRAGVTRSAFLAAAARSKILESA
jgi:predicted RNase H-like HicB family nuclease